MDDGGGKFDHGVCLVLVCTRSRLSPPPFKALDGPVESRQNRGSIHCAGGNADSYFAGSAGGVKLPLSAVHVLQMVALFLQPGSLCPLR